jgi:predicted kinase/diadenosine tetraphosphatase ApaH/serine/threonine PP2A family protein phosphatase
MQNSPKTITYPPAALVILVGPSGSGKSTFAARHFGPTEVISSDRCRAMIVDDEASQEVNDDAFDLLSRWLDLRLKHRRFTVVDSTALKPFARENLARIAAEHDVPCFALALDVPLDECLRRDAARPNRSVGENVVRKHHAQFENAKREIARDKSLAGYDILSPAEAEGVVFAWEATAEDGARFDVIGDVHGCWLELGDLLEKLGYVWQEGLPVHPEGRIPAFVGDLADRGPDSPRVLRTVADLVAKGKAVFVPGNHDDKLFRMLQGRNVSRTHGLDLTEQQINALPDRERKMLKRSIMECLATAKPYAVLDGSSLVIAHAGIREEMIGKENGRIREFTLYGDVRGFEPGTNKPIRYDWASEYRGSALIAYGHTPQEEIRFVNNTINLDGGCVFGGQLCALRYPEREVVCVPARQIYAYHEGLSFSRPV